MDYVSKKRRIRLMLLAYSGVLGIVAVFMPDEDKALDFLIGLPWLVLAVMWCHVDANQREHVMGKFMRVSLVLFFLLAFPIYVFQTRGFAGFKTLVLVFLFVAAMFACVFITGFVTLCIGNLTGVIET